MSELSEDTSITDMTAKNEIQDNQLKNEEALNNDTKSADYYADNDDDDDDDDYDYYEDEMESIISIDDDVDGESIMQEERSVDGESIMQEERSVDAAESQRSQLEKFQQQQQRICTAENTVFHENSTLNENKENEKEPSIQTVVKYGFDEEPMFEYEFFQNPIIELGRRLWSSSVEQQHYTKGCLWSPDGTCLLVPVHLDGMHVIELPQDLYTVQKISKERTLSPLPSAIHVKEGGTVYDYAWYPFMSSSEPDTCCWLATRQHEPIHMWDAFTSELRCTYRGYNEVDEVETAISIIFSPDGEKIFGGYKKSLKIFDTHVPGRDYRSIPVKQTVSCMAVTATNDNCVTAGSWNGFIYHYDVRTPRMGALFSLSGHSGGVTWLLYQGLSDTEWHLFSGARKDDKILHWDMRNYTKPMQTFKRDVATNQRIYFDIDYQKNKWLISGDTQGYVRVWNLHDSNQNAKIPLHKDCCNGVNIHPSLPILASTSGQYHFTDVTNDDKETPNETKVIEYENSLLLTWLGDSY